MEKKLLIHIRGISKSFYGIHVLRDINLTIFPSEIHIICSENSIGKSTLMDVFTSALSTDYGDILFEGQKILFSNSKSYQNPEINVEYQEITFCFHLNRAENIFISRIPTRFGFFIHKDKTRQQTSAILKRLDTQVATNGIVSKLSLLQQQWAGIARTMSRNCRMLILDEPTSALTNKLRIFAWITIIFKDLPEILFLIFL